MFCLNAFCFPGLWLSDRLGYITLEEVVNILLEKPAGFVQLR